jgi:aminoglycoside phosphotransferase (APT) family kinase protein
MDVKQNEWDADIEVNDELARKLIDSQFADLAPAELSLLGVGWDNAAYLVNASYVFRFPRRQFAADTIANEVRCLRLIAPGLPLPISAPTYVGAPVADYPYPFAGYRRLAGETACRLTWTAEQRAAVAGSLGSFLRALHSLHIDDATRSWAPQDELRRAALAYRLPKVLERLQVIGNRKPHIPAQELAALAEALSHAAPHPGLSCWVHGDLYARHLLASDDRRLTGVIDWGDVHLGDPAVDLGIVFSFLPASARPQFRDAYGPIDAETWKRARFRAIHYGAILNLYGDDTGDTAIRDAGETALRFALES